MFAYSNNKGLRSQFQVFLFRTRPGFLIFLVYLKHMIFPKAFEKILESFTHSPSSLAGVSSVNEFIPILREYYDQQLSNSNPAPTQRPTQKTNHLIILSNEEACHNFAKRFSRPINLILNPSPQPYSDIDYSRKTMSKRMISLYRALETTIKSNLNQTNKNQIFISHPTALSLLTLNPQVLLKQNIKFEYADTFYTDPVQSLIQLGYSPVTFVEEVGQFSIKGGIVDVFSPAEEMPIRISLFGDEIESLHKFSALNQRNISEAESLNIIPAQELFYNDDNQKRLLSSIHNFKSKDQEWKTKTIDCIRGRKAFDKMNLFSSSFCEGKFTALDYFEPQSTNVICFDYRSSESYYSQYQQELDNDFKMLNKTDIKSQIDPSKLFKKDFDLRAYKKFIDISSVLIEDLSVQKKLIPETKNINYSIHSLSPSLKFNKSKSVNWQTYAKDIVDLIKNLLNQNDIVIFSKGSTSLKRCESFLTEYGIEFTKQESLTDLNKENSFDVYLIPGEVKVSAKYDLDKIVILNSDELFGNTKEKTSKTTDASQFFDTLDLLQISELNLNDLVVHRNHGVGSYKGLKLLNLNNVESECLEIEYSNKDKLFLPVYSIHHIRKYSDSKSTRSLDKLGGTSWQKLTSKAQKKLKDIAQDLVALYAKRKATKRVAISTKSSEYKLFEGQFPYQETDDQLRAIQDIEDDLKKDYVMDRLVCGDVGFGKTEVAMRAAFHYIQSGKQVALMAPTTVLSMQHYQSFSKRFKNWPFTTKALNRFVSKSDTTEALKDLKAGKLDLVVGTHRVLSSDVEFKNLGLLIVDEEQKFGVKQKERIKSIQEKVDVLSLSATPIPRTLNMGFLGVRDLSLIKTPPKDRLPVKTYITHYSKQVIKKAIEAEVARNGQVFFVHNRVQSIQGIYEELKELLPDIKIGLGHGQMKESELEKVMIKFFNKEIDVLLSTTIIESGVDVSSANTILINNAQNFGLSQLYQLRGRVGRSENRAYCYLLVPPNRDLEKIQKEKLKVLQDNTALGSGIQIAHHDLELRGAGNLLGEAQSGHAEEMGYDLYIELLEEAVTEAKGLSNESIKKFDPEIIVPLPALIPNKYIQDIKSRLLYYRKISKVINESDLDIIESELQDQFGKIPEQVFGLFYLTTIKIHLITMGVKELKSGPKNISLSLNEANTLNFDTFLKAVKKQPTLYKVSPNNKIVIKYTVTDWPSLFDFVLQIKSKFFDSFE